MEGYNVSSDAYRNSDNMDNDESHRMWDAKKEEYEYHNEEADESKDYLKPSEPNHSGVAYDPSTDFIVMLPISSSAFHRTVTLHG